MGHIVWWTWYPVSAWWISAWTDPHTGRRSWKHGSGQLWRFRFAW